jgi:peptidoglycan/LPS O-acetylase OafA/YrhL
MDKNIQNSRLKELDALRGLAALMVVFFHFTMGRTEAKLGFKLGTTGVDLFFIISGFVIYMSIGRVKTSLDFVINRVSRLYPTYWTCVTFTFILIAANSIFKNAGSEHIDFIAYIANMTMFHFYFEIPSIDGTYWTMIIEMIFYLGILFLFHFKWLKYLNLIGLALTLIVVAAASFWPQTYLVTRIMYWMPLLQFIPLFLAGTVFYKIYTSETKRLENYALLFVCLISQILLFKFAGGSKRYISHSEYAIMLVIYFSLFILFVNNKLGFIVSKWSLFLGKISFALYLIHQYISIRVIIPYLVDDLHYNFWLASLFVALPVVILLASLITYFIEVPFSKKLKEKLRSLTSVKTSPSVGN